MVIILGCIFLQESFGFLRFPFLWHFFSQESQFLFHRNFFRTSSGNLSVWGLCRKLCGIFFFLTKTEYNAILWYSIMASIHHHCCAASTIAIAASPLLHCHHHCHPHCCAIIAIAVTVLPLPLLRRLSRCCPAIAVAAPPLPLLRCHCHCCTTTFSAIAALIAAPPLLHCQDGDRRLPQWRRRQ
jgi:hypothetical protein